jgi:hypothetical protein
MCYDYSIIYKKSPKKLPRSRSRPNVSGIDYASCEAKGLLPTGIYKEGVRGIRSGKLKVDKDGNPQRNNDRGFLIESITFGYTTKMFSKNRPTIESRANRVYPVFYKELKNMINNIDPKFKYDSICVNHNLECKEHIDKFNKASSIIVAWGDYEGGELLVEGVPFNIKESPLRFNGGICRHKTMPFKGDRWSAIFFNKYDYYNKIKE